MTRLVSCVLVAFNHGRWVREAVESILGHDWPDDRLQLILVDNGSDDDTGSILEEYRDRAEVLRLDRLPPNDAFSAGMQRARGEYVTVFSGDDVWLPGRLTRLVRMLDEDPAVGLAFGDMEVIDADGELLHPSWRVGNGMELPSRRLFGTLLERNLVFGPAVLMRAELAALAYPIPAVAAWDDWWFATAIARVAQIAFTPHPVARYRRYAGSLSAMETEEKQVAFLREDLRFRGWLLQELGAGEASPEEVTSAALAQIDGSLRLAQQRRRSVESAIGLTSGGRRRAHAAARAAAGSSDPRVRLALLANAVGHDPTDPSHGRALSEAAGEAERLGLEADEPLQPAAIIDDARAHVTLALGSELVATPALMAEYLGDVGPADERTLAILAQGSAPEALAAQLESTIASLGVDPEAAPDMVVLTLPDSLTAACAATVRCDDLLTRGAAKHWPYANLPRFRRRSELEA